MSPNLEHQHKSEELKVGKEAREEKVRDFLWTVILILVGIILVVVAVDNWKELLSLLGF